MNPLDAISPVDGRYYNKTKDLRFYFSEHALIRYRVQVEIEYFIHLVQIPLPQLESFNAESFETIRKIYSEFSSQDAEEVKEIEKTINHDVKAVEYFIKKKFDDLGLANFKEFIHFGLTSQDINNTAIPLSILEAKNKEIVPRFEQLIETLEYMADEYKSTPMLAHTHGQPASPTRVGKELKVFVVRLKNQLAELVRLPNAAKFGGATGNFNAHHLAYPSVNWESFASSFLESLGLQHSFPTTQIEHYDYLAAFCDANKRLNNIIIDLNRDCWTYISMDYFKQKINKNEIGSSAMPHKVNPIDFENSEGNAGLAVALFDFFSSKLPISRLQRDLTDSTVLRNIGVPIAHTVIAIESTLKGLSKLIINNDKLTHDLEQNWLVTAEAIQTILRREGYPNPYETLKSLTRNNVKISQETISIFIDELDVKESIKEELKQISPFNYTGI